MKQIHLVVAILAALGGSPAFAGEPPRYVATSLESVFDHNAFIRLNDAGDIAGYGTDTNAPRILKSTGDIIDLPDPYASSPGMTGTITGINLSGEVVGYGFQDEVVRGWTYDAVHQITHLSGQLSSLSNSGLAAGGYALGVWNLRTRSYTPYWNDGQSYYVEDVAESGEIIANRENLPFLFAPGIRVPLSLGGFGRGKATYLSEGLVVGTNGNARANEHLVFWNFDGTIRSQHTFGTRVIPQCVTNDGGVSLLVERNNEFRLHLYRDEWGLTEVSSLLDTPIEGTIVGASAFNTRNELIVVVQRSTGHPFEKYLLTPVPEPATLTALGLGALAIHRKRRK